MKIVAADIGGTHARFALAELRPGERPRIGDVRKYRTREHDGLASAWAAFARDKGGVLPGAAALAVAVTDADGFEMATRPASWSAVFGPYGDVTRSPDIVPLQVQCLASLLAAGPESRLGRVVLSPDGQACGTYAPPKKS